MSDDTKSLLPEDRIPKSWYNIAADLAEPLAPVLHPAPASPSAPMIWRRCFPWR